MDGYASDGMDGGLVHFPWNSIVPPHEFRRATAARSPLRAASYAVPPQPAMPAASYAVPPLPAMPCQLCPLPAMPCQLCRRSEEIDVNAVPAMPSK
eukprot:6289573-Lingulodinium_polyedra.AAC.2